MHEAFTGPDRGSVTQIRRGTLEELLDQGPPLWQEHFAELIKPEQRERMRLQPDVEKYRALEAAEVLFVLLAFDGSLLVGYSVNFIMSHLHYAGFTYCANDLFFVTKAKRGTSIGGRLRKLTLETARGRGARRMTWHSKPDTDMDVFMRATLPVFETIYAEDL